MKDYKTKVLCVKRFGWKRIAKNTQRFGWILDSAEQETTVTEETTYEGSVVGDTVYINPRTHRTSKVRVWLSFYRYSSDYKNLSSIFFLEALYNLFFFIRRILAFFLPIVSVVALVVAFSGGSDIVLKYGGWLAAAFFVWLGMIIFEGILSRIARKILKNK